MHLTSYVDEIGETPLLEIRPSVGRSPTTLHMCAGYIRLAFVSPPTEAEHKPMVVATVAPLLLPPGLESVKKTDFVRPPTVG